MVVELCGRLRDRWPVAAAMVPLSDLLANLVDGWRGRRGGELGRRRSTTTTTLNPTPPLAFSLSAGHGAAPPETPVRAACAQAHGAAPPETPGRAACAQAHGKIESRGFGSWLAFWL
jgi:hypothetical protein